MKIILLFIFFLFNSLAIAHKELVHNAFSAFYPYLVDNICRKKAFELEISKMPIEQIIDIWKRNEKYCSKDGDYQLILAGLYASKAMSLSYGHFNYEASKNILEKAIKSVNYDTRYHKLHLCSAYIGLGETNKAIDLAEQMIRDYPNWHGGFLSLGGYYFYSKKYDFAKIYLEKAAIINDKDPDTYLMLGYIAYVQGEKNEKVIEYYDKAGILDLIQTLLDRRGCAAKAVVLINQGKFEDAKCFLDAEQKVDPDVCKEERFLRVRKYYEEELKNKQMLGRDK